MNRTEAFADFPPELEELTSRIIGVGIEVSNSLGIGFLESVYRNALCVEFARRNLKYESEKRLEVHYQNVLVGEFRADLIVESKVLVELKVAKGIDDAHIGQAVNYLRISGLPVALILNLGTTRLGIRRILPAQT